MLKFIRYFFRAFIFVVALTVCVLTVISELGCSNFIRIDVQTECVQVCDNLPTACPEMVIANESKNCVEACVNASGPINQKHRICMSEGSSCADIAECTLSE